MHIKYAMINLLNFNSERCWLFMFNLIIIYKLLLFLIFSFLNYFFKITTIKKLNNTHYI